VGKRRRAYGIWGNVSGKAHLQILSTEGSKREIKSCGLRYGQISTYCEHGNRTENRRGYYAWR